MRLLIRAPNWIGDAALSLPAVRDVRRNFPDARVEVLARGSVKELYAAVPEVDAVREIKRDPHLTERQRDILVEIYSAFRAANRTSSE